MPPISLSPCERKTLEGYAFGLIAPEIAAREGWSPNLPHVYMERVKRKMRCRTRYQVLYRYAKLKLDEQPRG